MLIHIKIHTSANSCHFVYLKPFICLINSFLCMWFIIYFIKFFMNTTYNLCILIIFEQITYFWCKTTSYFLVNQVCVLLLEIFALLSGRERSGCPGTRWSAWRRRETGFDWSEWRYGSAPSPVLPDLMTQWKVTIKKVWNMFQFDCLLIWSWNSRPVNKHTNELTEKEGGGRMGSRKKYREWGRFFYEVLNEK